MTGPVLPDPPGLDYGWNQPDRSNLVRDFRIFDREPALLLAFATGALQLVSAFFFHLTENQTGVLNGAFALALGAVTAAMVARDKLVPALLGLLQGLLSVGVAFGFDLGPDRASALTAFLAVGLALFVRQTVTAKVPPPRPAADVELAG